MANKIYRVHNGPNPSTAGPVKVATGTAIITLLQIACPATRPVIRPVAWGISLDGGAGTAGDIELVETDVPATITAYVAADIEKYTDPNAPASAITIGSTTASGYTATVEGTTTVTRTADGALMPPSAQYSYTWPLDREFECIPGRFLRVRATFASTVNAHAWVLYQEG